ncbi:MAG: hypothetical protein ACRECH_10435, partial [Nitrososphaerales archaeon]
AKSIDGWSSEMSDHLGYNRSLIKQRSKVAQMQKDQMKKEVAEKYDVGVVGLGAVGKALFHVLAFYHNCAGYDIKGSYSWRTVLSTKIVFICVQTPLGEDNRLDCRYVEDVLKRLHRDGYSNPIVIRSTLRVGFMSQASERFPSLRIVYSPEFLRERSSLQWTAVPDRLVLAGRRRDVNYVQKFLGYAEDAKVIKTDFRTAEIGKLAHNAFIATKVSFTNEIEKISNELAASPSTVMEIVSADRRVKSKEHLLPGLGPYEGKCVPKDTMELMQAGGESSRLLRAVHRVNEITKASSGKKPGHTEAGIIAAFLR